MPLASSDSAVPHASGFGAESEVIITTSAIVHDDARTASGHCLDTVGCCFDLDFRVVSISQRHSCEALLAFVRVVAEYTTVGGLQVLASYINLYSAIIRSMGSFTSDLFRAFGGLTNETKLVPLSDDDRLIILVWRVKLMLLGLLESEFGLGALLIEFDA